MDRRSIRSLGLLLLLAQSAVGCKMLDGRKPADAAAAKSEAEPVEPALRDDFRAEGLSSAHSAGRSAASWSSEAREIESHFNVR